MTLFPQTVLRTLNPVFETKLLKIVDLNDASWVQADHEIVLDFKDDNSLRMILWHCDVS